MSRGDGRVFRRGVKFYVEYYSPGEDGKKKQTREVAGDSEKGALLLLRERLRQVANDRVGLEKFVPPSAKRTLMKELFDEVVRDYERRGLRSLRELKNHQRRPRLEFGAKSVLSVTTRAVEDYVAMRQKEHAAPATIDRETETIQRAFSLAAARGTRLFAPHIPKMLKKNANARQGFLERADFDRVLAAIGDADLVDALEWMWWTGMRAGETAALTWDAYDGTTLRLAAKDAKTGVGRAIPVVGPLAPIVARREARKDAKSPLVFHSRGATLRAKSGGFQFRLWKLWRAACAAAGEDHAIVHDLRRVAVRNLIGAGTSMRVAMLITGHQTTSTFMRYQVATTADVAEALEATEVYVQTRAEERKVLPFAVKNKPKNEPKAGA